MKKVITVLLFTVCFLCCKEKKETIDFVTLKKTEFNSKAFEIPNGKIPDSVKHAHDSCMEFSFDANAMFISKRDSFFIGSIVNRKSLKTLNTLSDVGLTQTQMMSEFNIISHPCYEKTVLHFLLKSLFGESFILQFPNVDKAINKEINDDIKAADNSEMQTGSWLYLDIKEALKNIIDTARNPRALLYKSNLFDSSNMVLMSVEAVTDVSFMINTKNVISEPLQALLRNKHSLSLFNSQTSIRLFYINANTFEMALNGFFPVAGEFMKAELK